LVVGAGPVGLFAALCAASHGLTVRVVDQVWRGYAPGRAALLHPRSVELLDKVAVGGAIRAAGHRIDALSLQVAGAEPLQLPLSSPAFAVPQSALEDTLMAALRDSDVEFHVPYQAVTIEQSADLVDVRMTRRELVTLGSPAHYGEWEPVESSVMQASFVIGADGYDSRVRSAIGVEPVVVGPTEVFAIFEGPLATPAEANIRLFFDDTSCAAILPLANGRARCSFGVHENLDENPDIERLRDLLAKRAAGSGLMLQKVDWGTVTQFERRLARRFGSGRVWLAGDAAHVTSPLGHQSLNAGLFEAYDVAKRIASTVKGSAPRDGVEGYGAAHAREWHKMLGVNVRFDVLPNAPPWLPTYARRLVSALPVSGADLTNALERIGLRLR
jgi:2-polyprenyl-6-methoxyphenol hydroxylase-like FAD-dependent oxidoreductase